jgi:hemolysin III
MRLRCTPRTPAAPAAGERIQSAREELLNAISHGVGLLLALVALPVLVVVAVRHGTAATVVGAVLFASTMALLYFASTVYHALPHGTWKRRFNRLDHASIYLFIAGSYMPFTLGPLRGPWGWSLFGVVWGIAAVGSMAKLLNRLRHPLWSTGLYVGMGWIAIVAVPPMIERMGGQALALLVAGGVAYTVGAVFFLLDHRVRYAHFIWHLFVLAGNAIHFVAVLLFAVVRGAIA